MHSLKIRNLEIKKGKIPIFVAEISGNHNQKFSTALKLIKAAKDSGADAVKFQYYDENDMTLNSKNKEFLIKDKKSPWFGKYLFNLYKKSSTPKMWFKKLFQYSNKIGLPCFTSVFNHEAVDFLEKIGNPAYKISSFEINHIPLIERVSKTGKPIILSTGVANDFEINQAVKICKKNKNNKIILLKCSSEYPAKLSESNLNTIHYFKKKYKCFVGLSDHTKGITAPISAYHKGACMIEKHLKLDEKRKVVDADFSLTPKEFHLMTSICKNLKSVEGKFKFVVSKSVKLNSKFKRSIYTSKKVKKGSLVNSKNIVIIRSNKGLHPKYYTKIMNKKFSKNLNVATPLKKSFLI